MWVLLDTCVLSELRKQDCPSQVKSAVEILDDSDLFVSVITLGEIAKGIALLDESKRKRALRDWLETLEQQYGERILPVDLETVRIWGEVTAKAQRAGKVVAAGDGLIAATAIRYGLHVMTRNVDDFLPTDVLLINPWDVA